MNKSDKGGNTKNPVRNEQNSISGKKEGIAPSSNVENKKESAKRAAQKAYRNNKKVKSFSYIKSGSNLLDMNITEIPYLIDGLFQKTGLVAVAGSSDTGKSSFLRQMATSIVLGEPDFLGFKILSEHKRVIYVSTEDDEIAVAYLLKKQNHSKVDSKLYGRMGFIFDTYKLLAKLEEALKTHKTDCVIIDAITDLFTGDMNQSNKIRSFIYDFQRLADKYHCLFIFLHHTKKGSQNNAPSKDNVLGSQGFEAKMRLVIELRKDHNNPEIRYLCIVKGNYIPESQKQNATVLKFDEHMRFTNQNANVPFSELEKKDTKNQKSEGLKMIAIELHKNLGLSSREIAQRLTKTGHKIGKTAVNNWINEYKQKQGKYKYVNPDDLIEDENLL